MVDPGADFAGYMEDMAKVEAGREATQELLQKHEIWRQTTWGGWAVRQMQSLAKKIEPFFTQTAHLFNDTDSASSAIIRNIIRFLAFIFLMVVIYVGSQILQKFIGDEIVVEEELVILHEHESEEAAAKARAKTTRSKKDRSNKSD